MNSTITYGLGALQFLFGVASLFTGWVDQGAAMGFITSGLAVFGLTHQNVKLGNALGKAI